MINVRMPDGSFYPVKRLLGAGDSNAKLYKSDKAEKGYLTYGLSLAPANESGYNVCQASTAGCREACLFTAGRGRMSRVRWARIAKTRAFFQHREAFLRMLRKELQHARARARRQGKKLAVRLNVLSDLPWEKIDETLFTEFHDVQFYDYTKIAGRTPPRNYHLTFSRSETNERQALQELQRGRNVAIVFSSKEIPAIWHGYDVINGDETDLRFLDPSPVVVGLYAKGRAKADDSGFVIPVQEVA